MLLGACVSDHPQGVMLPVAGAVPGTGTVDMLVATTRRPARSPANMFGGLRGDELAFADIGVSIPAERNRTIGEVQWPQQLPGNPVTDFVTRRAAVIDRPHALALLHDHVKRSAKKNVLVFVHGFNNRFEDSVYRFAQIVHDSGTDAVPVLFTWPSKGSILAYGYDRESSTYSRDQLEGVLKALASDPAVGEVSVLAHSMGNWLLLESLRQMAIRDGQVAPKIKNVLLAAPDVDIDVARTQIAAMGPNRPAFALFVSREDKALALSADLHGAEARLGSIDPLDPSYRAMLVKDRVAVFDLSALNKAGDLNHDTFATSPKIVELIGTRLARGQTVAESGQHFSDTLFNGTTGAVSTFGNAAGLIVSAPTAAFDADACDTYGERFSSFKSGMFGR